VSLRRLRILAAALACGLPLAGCATSSYSTHHAAGGQMSGEEVADSNNDGAYVQADGITYQLQISRQLNPYAAEDKQFFVGLPAGQNALHLNAQQLWYGVFLWAKNQHHREFATSDRFEIVDTLGNVYRPVALNPKVNPFAWTRNILGYGQTEPGQDTVAGQFYSGGKLLLFKLNTSIYSNRPLTFFILSHDGSKRLASISLDL
jgi:hypothetical protein